MDLLVGLQSNHLGTAQGELPDGSYPSQARPGKEVRLRAAGDGRNLPRHVIYRVITFAGDDKIAYLGATLLDMDPYPASGRGRRRASTSRVTRPSVSSPARLRSPFRSWMQTACPTWCVERRPLLCRGRA
ncbi:hypothetical protein ACFCYH_15980 [Streptomyces sp. NPDC056400]|uniref:hypothetical protein n=1 Tax=Streptomyces sp. NPDC056400 TaxID=3345808 RepID=UPI0035E3AAA5